MYMVSIIGEEKKSAILGKKLGRRLKSCGGACLVTRSEITPYPDDKGNVAYTIVVQNGFEFSEISCGIVLFYYPENISSLPMFISDKLICLAMEDDEKALTILRFSKNITLTCGLSLRAVITLSSMTDKSAVVSLQREIHAENAGFFSPMDIPIGLKEKTDGRLIALTTAVILLTAGIPDGHIEF